MSYTGFLNNKKERMRPNRQIRRDTEKREKETYKISLCNVRVSFFVREKENTQTSIR